VEAKAKLAVTGRYCTKPGVWGLGSGWNMAWGGRYVEIRLKIEGIK
jgi:hypothetical protein